LFVLNSFAYANEIHGYRNVLASLYNIIFASFGDFGIGIEEMQDSTQYISLILIFAIISMVSLVLMNIFIGVVSAVYEKTEAESIVQFDEDLDEYMRDGMSEDDRTWSRHVVYPTFEECLSRSVDGDGEGNDAIAELRNRMVSLEEKLLQQLNALTSLVKK
jgi:hypothetical protein